MLRLILIILLLTEFALYIALAVSMVAAIFYGSRKLWNSKLWRLFR